MAEKKKAEAKKEVPREETHFEGVPLKELKNHPELHESYEDKYGYAELNKWLK